MNLQEEVCDFIPNKLIDVHTHIGLEEFVSPFSPTRQMNDLTAYRHQSWEELVKVYQYMYPGKTVCHTCGFGFVLNEVNVRVANSYLIKKAQCDSHLLPLLLATPQDTNALIDGFKEAQQKNVHIYGVKPYWDFANTDGRRDVREVSMHEYVTTDMLEFCNEHHLILMLHTSGIGMGDPVIRNNVESILNQYPNIKLILAHLGRYFETEQFFKFIDSDFMKNNRSKNFWFDMSCVTEREVYDYVFSHEEFYSRLLFGTDYPYGLMQTTLPSGEVTYNNYVCIKNIKDAMEKNLPSSLLPKIKKDFFYQNAYTLFDVSI